MYKFIYGRLLLNIQIVVFSVVSKSFVLGEVVEILLEVSVLSADDEPADNGNCDEDCEHRSNNDPDYGLASNFIRRYLISGCVHLAFGDPVSIECESGVVIVEHDVEALHEDVSEDELSCVASVDTQLTHAVTLAVLGVDQILSWADLVCSVFNEVESELVEVSDPEFALSDKLALHSLSIASEVSHVACQVG